MVTGNEDGTFEAFYRKELAVITALAAVMTGSVESGADVAHEAMLRAYREWDSRVSRLERPGAWVRRVAINLSIDAKRRERRARTGLARLARERGADVDAAIDGVFWSAVRDLPPRQRAVVSLHYLEDLSVRDIATTLRMREGAVRSALFVARQQLSRTLTVDEAER